MAESKDGPTQASAFSTWLDDFFTAYYRRRPVNATFIGVHDYDDRLPDYSGASVDETMAEIESLIARLRALPPEPLSQAEALDRRLAEGYLEIQLREFASQHFPRGNPSFYVGEAIFGVMSLFLRDFGPLQARVEAAAARLEAIPRLLQQARANLRAAPLAWTERAIRECDGSLALLTEGIDSLVAEKGFDGARLKHAAKRAASAVAEFRSYLIHDLSRHPVASVACGAEALDLLIRRGHFLPWPAEEIERYASEQLREATSRLQAGASAFGTANWREALAMLQEIHPSAENYYARYREIWNAHRAAAEAHDLLTWPNSPIRYVPRPRWARAAAPSLYFLFYRAPAAFDDIPVVDYLVEPVEPDMPTERQEQLLRATNESVIKLNHVVHHGGVGHHVQNWHAYRAASRIGQIAAVDCASRIAMFCGGTMAEGWACYATGLMDEIGFLTPLESFGEIHARSRMAARAIVDIRLHTGRFSLQDADQFYQEWTAMSAGAARTEATKNSMFPGAALMYLAGTDQLHALRREMADREGAMFDLHAFHDRVLSFGSVPVTLVAEQMRRGIAADAKERLG